MILKPKLYCWEARWSFLKKLDGVFPYVENKAEKGDGWFTLATSCSDNVFLAGPLLGAVRES